MNAFISLEALSGPPKPASASGDDRREPVDRVVALGLRDLVGRATSALLIRLTSAGALDHR